MTTDFRHYRGLDLQPLVYPHRATTPGSGHNYQEGFDAAVCIREPEGAPGSRSRVFRLAKDKPFQSAGDARRALMAFAENLIDTLPSSGALWELEP